MKQLKLPYYLTSLVLLGGVAFTPVIQASAVDSAAIVNAIRQLDTYGNSSSEVKGQLDQIREIVTKHYELTDEDYRNKEVAGAIINYWADVALKEYEFKKELHFMNAPATEKAISTGQEVKKLTDKNYATELIESIFRRSISAFWPEEETAEQAIHSPKMRLYAELSKNLAEDPEDLQSPNIGAILNKDRVEKEKAEDYIGFMTGQRLKVNREIAEKLKNGTELSLAEREEVAEKFIKLMNMAPSVNAYSELFGRRISEQQEEGATEGEEQKTTMELMKEYSNLRFNSPEWYGLIGKASDTALLREIAHLLAYNTWMEKESYRLKEQEVVLLATMNANFARMLAVMDSLYEQFEALDDATRQQALEAEKKLRDLKLETED